MSCLFPGKRREAESSISVSYTHLDVYKRQVDQDEPSEDGTIVFHLHVAPDDMGRVIGKQGRIAKAMRTVMRAAATRQDAKVSVEID